MIRLLTIGLQLEAGWVEVVVGIAAIIITLIIYKVTRNRKSLSYDVLSKSPLISIDDEIRGNLQVLFNGLPVENIHLILLRIVNDGDAAVTTNDFERPLSFSFEPETMILSAQTTEQTPSTLKPELKTEPNRVELMPLLLNSKDSITIKLLVTQFTDTINVDARIIGIREIKRIESERDRISEVFDGIKIAYWALVCSVVISLIFTFVLDAIFGWMRGAFIVVLISLFFPLSILVIKRLRFRFASKE